MFAEHSRQGVDYKGWTLGTSVVRFRLLPVVQYRRLGSRAPRTARVNLRFNAVTPSNPKPRLFEAFFMGDIYGIW